MCKVLLISQTYLVDISRFMDALMKLSFCNRCFWTSQILWWVLTSMKLIFFDFCNGVMTSQTYYIDVTWFIGLFHLITCLFRCSLASQILWWILTSIKLIFFDMCQVLMKSQTYSIDVTWLMDSFIKLPFSCKRWFWPSQILWWILISTKLIFFDICKVLMTSFTHQLIFLRLMTPRGDIEGTGMSHPYRFVFWSKILWTMVSFSAIFP